MKGQKESSAKNVFFSGFEFLEEVLAMGNSDPGMYGKFCVRLIDDDGLQTTISLFLDPHQLNDPSKMRTINYL